jgi:hypothetical protein
MAATVKYSRLPVRARHATASFNQSLARCLVLFSALRDFDALRVCCRCKASPTDARPSTRYASAFPSRRLRSQTGRSSTNRLQPAGRLNLRARTKQCWIATDALACSVSSDAGVIVTDVISTCGVAKYTQARDHVGHAKFRRNRASTRNTCPVTRGHSATCENVSIRLEPDDSATQFVHGCGPRKLLKDWLLRLDSNQQPSG